MIHYTIWVIAAIFVWLLSVEGQRRGHPPMSELNSAIFVLLSTIQVTLFININYQGPAFIWFVIGLNSLYQFLTKQNFFYARSKN